MTKTQVTTELLARIADALAAELTEDSYSEFIKGSITMRLDFVKKPTKYFLSVNLPGNGKPKIEVVFTKPKRKYTRLIDRVVNAD